MSMGMGIARPDMVINSMLLLVLMVGGYQGRVTYVVLVRSIAMYCTGCTGGGGAVVGGL